MKKNRMAGLVAAAMAMNSLLMMPVSTAAMETIKVEAETGTLQNDAEVATTETGFSGTGYVHLKDNAATTPTVTLKFNVEEAGNYELRFGYMAPFGTKRGTVEVNGEKKGEAIFEECDTFQECSFGKVNFVAGENTVTLQSTWGYTILDYITVGDYVAPTRPEITATHKALSDPNATTEAKQLFAYLNSVYGKHILSGQQEIYMNGPHDVETEFNYIKEKTGKLPAIRGFDYGNFCCPAFGSDDGSTQRVINWAEQGGIVTSSFHLNVPTDFASYTIGSRIDFSATTYSEKTDFSPSKAATEGTKENQYYTQALDTLCEQFAILQDKGITVLWRPLHEAEGNGGENSSWFWWGSEGSSAYRKLYQYTYKYMTETKGLHNLIWEWNSYDYSSSANWYPGDAYVDIIGYDKYNCTDWSTGSAVIYHNTNPETDIFYSMMGRYNNAKMVALMECDCFSTLSDITGEKAGWLYFMPWYDGGSESTNFLSNPVFNTVEDLVEMYQSEYCITLDELPDFSTIEVTDETNEPINTEPTEVKEGHASIVTDAKGTTTIDFPEASDTVVLVVETDGEASGGLGTSIEVNGTYYWVNVEWAASKSGEVEVTLLDNVLNVTEGTTEVADEAIKKAVLDKLNDQKSFQFQVWSGEATLTDAYIKKTGGSTDPTEPSDTTDPTDPTTPSDTEEKIDGVIETDTTGAVRITLPQGADTVYLDITLPNGTDYANGGLGAVVEVDGKYYWANLQWEAKKSGETSIKLAEQLLDVSLDDKQVKDENVIAAIKEKLSSVTEFEFQVWYVNDGETSDVVLNSAYIKVSSGTEPTEEQPTEEKPTEEQPTDSTLPEAEVYGDVNGDGEVDILDVIMLNKFLLGSTTLDAQSKGNADVDNNNVIDSTDSLNILKKVVKLRELPVE